MKADALDLDNRMFGPLPLEPVAGPTPGLEREFSVNGR